MGRIASSLRVVQKSNNFTENYFTFILQLLKHVMFLINFLLILFENVTDCQTPFA